MFSRLLPIGLFAVLLLVACKQPQAGTVLDPPKPIEDFTFETDDGGTISLSDYQEKIVVLYFGYTFCPDVCPTTLADVKRALEKLGRDADQVQFIMITVDPERDSAARLGEYLRNFNPTFVGLRTDDLDYLQEAVLSQFGIYYEHEEVKDSAAGYMVTHTSSLIVLDRAMQWRELIPYATPPEAIAADLRRYIRER